eukprot:PhF_6_TR14957/c0_g1_i2/m.23475
MVLLKLVGDRVALLGQPYIIWHADESMSLQDSLTILLDGLNHPGKRSFLQEYILLRSGSTLDVGSKISSLGFEMGEALTVQSKSVANAPALDRIDPSLRTAGPYMATPAPQMNTSFPQHLAAVSAQQTIMEEVSQAVHMRFKEELSRMEQTRKQKEVERHEKQNMVDARNHALLMDFLKKFGLFSYAPKLKSIGVRTLNNLCGRSSQEISTIGITLRQSFELISEAHDEMVRRKLPIDWCERLTDLYHRYNPARVEQVPSIMKEWEGQETDVWNALRAKYEAALFQETMSDVKRALEPKQPVTSTAGLKDVVEHASRVATQMKTAQPNMDMYCCPTCGNLFQIPPSKVLSETLEALQDERKKFDDISEGWMRKEKELRATITKLTHQLQFAEAECAKQNQSLIDQTKWCESLEQKLKLTQSRLTDVTQEFDHAIYRAREENIASQSPSLHHQQHQHNTIVEPSYQHSPYIPPTSALRGTPERYPLSDQISNSRRREEMLISSQHPTNQSLVNSPEKRSRHAMPDAVEASSTLDKTKLRQRLIEFYAYHAPDKVHLVDLIIQQCAGKEHELERLMDLQPIVVRNYSTNTENEAPAQNTAIPGIQSQARIPNVRWAH